MHQDEIMLLANWSEPDNRTGARTATPGSAFWDAWNRHKEALKSSGVRCFKNPDDEWKCEWAQRPAYSNQPQVPPPRHSAATKEVPKGKHVWSNEQEAIQDWFENGTHNLAVRARAGTGKTTTISAAFSRSRDRRILYAVFNKKNQIEAAAKIRDPRVEVKTLHSVGYACILGVWPGVKPDGQVEVDRLKELAGDLKEELAGSILKLVGLAKNICIDPTPDDVLRIADEYMIDIAEYEDPEWNDARAAELVYAICELSKTRDPMNRISFNDMVWLPVVMNWVRPFFDLVVVDEAQDMNLPQLTMAQRASCGRVCVVGDDRQCIYGFRGAVSDGIGIMKRQLQAIELGLTITYRCPKSVVALAAEFVPDYKAADCAPEGIVDRADEGGIIKAAKAGDAILARINAALMPICLSLIRAGVPARIEGRDIGKQLMALVRKMKAKSIPDFLAKVDKWRSRQIKRLLKSRNAEDKMQQIEDQAETLIAIAEGLECVSAIEARIDALFQDSSAQSRPAVVLSTVHKAKGLEWERVFLLRQTFLRKHTREEENIYYVSVTRAKNHLTFVGGEPAMHSGAIRKDAEKEN